MKNFKKLASLIVFVIGLYMIRKFNDLYTQLLSGIAFVLIGASGLIK